MKNEQDEWVKERRPTQVRVGERLRLFRGRSADFGEVTGANLNVLLTVSLRKMYTIWGRSFPAKGPAETPGGNGRKPGEQGDPFVFLGGRSGCCPERGQDTGLHE